MAPHADEISPSVTNAAHGGKIPENGEYLKNGANPKAEEFSYPPTVPQNAPYSIVRQYHSKPTKLRVACIGAGASGLCLAYKMGKMLVPGSWELTLFDKNPHFGGTWYENTYPGVACDVSRVKPFQCSQYVDNINRSHPTFTPSVGIRSPTGRTTLRTATRSSATLRTLPKDMARKNT